MTPTNPISMEPSNEDPKPSPEALAEEICSMLEVYGPDATRNKTKFTQAKILIAGAFAARATTPTSSEGTKLRNQEDRTP